MRQQPLISIITPVYNRADCIGRCLESVRIQVCDVPFEHIVVDDGSTDNSYWIASLTSPMCDNLKVLRLEHNKGTNAARNAAIEAASGKFILLLDSDDQIAEGALQLIADTIAKNPNIKHFLFATDDRADYYASQGYAEAATSSFYFKDFLEEKIGGDFAHVLLRETMLKHPFEEKVRIFEGVFFLSFYKEAGEILFTNKIVLNRDRSRDDRVSYILIADNKKSLQRHVDALSLCVVRFKDDYAKSQEGRNVLRDNLLKYHKFASMLGKHQHVIYCENELRKLDVAVPILYKFLDRINLGPAFFTFARLFIKAKYLFKSVD